ncbi:glycosyltransferase family 2 protein [Tamlana crocina]|uniref:Glycosyltransferase n=1 Tax=Tamlana crocina TaxID=393006 RepID=A0ABX1DCW5_9FLAO|nr:glycosyltransferase family 2 protein [Tamlana crocina]NJX15051.1 glycosyltransferase [Tamlana crocina]
MIVLVHENNRPLQVLDASLNELKFSVEPSIMETMFALAKTFPDDIIMWCYKTYVKYINTSEISNIFYHKQIMASFSVCKTSYIPKAIGFIDQSVFVNVKYDVRYPTWLMSSDIGGVSAEFLNATNGIKSCQNFDYFLNSLAKLAMPKGLFCYSEPKFLKELPGHGIQTKKASTGELFQFAKQHYKWVWTYMLLLCQIIYHKRITFFSFVRSLFYKKRSVTFQSLEIQSSKVVVNKKEIDVVIPTIGRKQYLYDVLKDLAVQTLLPKNVIVVEQNPSEKSVSELNFLTEDDWPFKIKHVFTHQTGACNARNIALDLVESEWVFLNDDDNRFEVHLLKSVFEKIEQYGVDVLTTEYLQKGETLPRQYNYTHQTGIFGSGCSVVKTESLKDIRFNMALEFGYGEDTDFGRQLRNSGNDVIFFPDLKIVHLKAPMGGFRTKFFHPWEKEKEQPKPSPTVMYVRKKFYTDEQFLGFKCISFFRYYSQQKNKNPFSYFSKFIRDWKLSIFWADKLEQH